MFSDLEGEIETSGYQNIWNNFENIESMIFVWNMNKKN